MGKLVQRAWHRMGIATDRVRLFLSTHAIQLLWGLGIASLLVPATAYAWRLYNPAAAPAVSEDQNIQNTAAPDEQPAASTGTKLHVQTDTAEASFSGSGDEPSEQGSQTNAQLRINGKSVPLPPDGTVHKEISSKNGTATVDVSIQSTSSGTSHASSDTSVNIDLNSKTVSESDDAG